MRHAVHEFTNSSHTHLHPEFLQATTMKTKKLFAHSNLTVDNQRTNKERYKICCSLTKLQKRFRRELIYMTEHVFYQTGVSQPVWRSSKIQCHRRLVLRLLQAVFPCALLQFPSTMFSALSWQDNLFLQPPTTKPTDLSCSCDSQLD